MPLLGPLLLTSLLLAICAGIYAWYYVYQHQNKLDDLKEAHTHAKKAKAAQEQAMQALDRRLHTIESSRQWYEDAIEKMTNSVEDVTIEQTKQSLEIQQLRRRERALLRAGLEPRSPITLPVHIPDHPTLIAGPRTPTPRVS